VPWPIAGLAGVAAAGLLVTVPAVTGKFHADPDDILLIGFLGLAAALETRFSGRASQADVTDGNALLTTISTVTGILLFLLACVPLLLPCNAHETATIWALARVSVAAMLMGGGILLRAWSITCLGARFNSSNAIASDAALESGHAYKHFAHPSELGLLMIAAGILSLAGQAIVWVLAIMFYVFCAARIHLEEFALIQHYGAAYRLYRASTFDPFPRLSFRSRGD
jgi:protein-S-isoprenylcysteine O-methyltransferase Ste14